MLLGNYGTTQLEAPTVAPLRLEPFTIATHSTPRETLETVRARWDALGFASKLASYRGITGATLTLYHPDHEGRVAMLLADYAPTEAAHATETLVTFQETGTDDGCFGDIRSHVCDIVPGATISVGVFPKRPVS